MSSKAKRALVRRWFLGTKPDLRTMAKTIGGRVEALTDENARLREKLTAMRLNKPKGGNGES